MDSAEPGAFPHVRSAAEGQVSNGMAGASPPCWKDVAAMQKQKPNNLKTALILASVAAVFFVGVFVKRIWFN
jgi:hypothetical protein